MEEPKFMKEGFAYIGEDEKWHIKENAPDWAKKEFKEFFNMVNPTDPDEDGIVIKY